MRLMAGSSIAARPECTCSVDAGLGIDGARDRRVAVPFIVKIPAPYWRPPAATARVS